LADHFASLAASSDTKLASDRHGPSAIALGAVINSCVLIFAQHLWPHY